MVAARHLCLFSPLQRPYCHSTRPRPGDCYLVDQRALTKKPHNHSPSPTLARAISRPGPISAVQLRQPNASGFSRTSLSHLGKNRAARDRLSVWPLSGIRRSYHGPHTLSQPRARTDAVLRGGGSESSRLGQETVTLLTKSPTAKNASLLLARRSVASTG